MDLELSFTTQEDVRNLIEQLIQYFWPAIKGQITIPFPSMTYHEAMIQYGSDKPDTRYDMRVGFSCRFIVFCLFGFFCPTGEFFIHTERSPLSAKVSKFCSILGTNGHWTVRVP